MARTSRSASARDVAPASPQSYLWRSRQPLQILVFLLPLILLYEISLALVLRDHGGVITNLAHERLLTILTTLGIARTSGLYLGGIVIVVILLVWHVLTRQAWRADIQTAGCMGGEALALTLPLLLLAWAIAHTPLANVGLAAGAGSGGGGGPGVQLESLSLLSKMAISVGAGLYEELLFRMLLIAVVHTVLVDIAGMKNFPGTAIAVIVSAVAFALYHPLQSAAGDVSLQKLTFFFLAGLYFGAIFAVRGFGIVVGVHALYDMVTVLLWLGGENSHGG